jgi:hypothetical protein
METGAVSCVTRSTGLLYLKQESVAIAINCNRENFLGVA